MRKNWLMTTAGIMSAIGSVPILVANSGTTHVPSWWGAASFDCLIIGAVGLALLGFAGKGQDEHSTADQVQISTIKQAVKVEEQQQKSAGA